MKDLFNARNHAVGIAEGRAGGHQVVENEAAFVHAGEQIGPHRAIGEEGPDHQQQTETRQNEWMRQRAV